MLEQSRRDRAQRDHGSVDDGRARHADWGEGKSFQIDFTRQVVADGKTWPMTVTMHYEPNADTTSFGSGTRTLPSQSELESFGKSVSSTDAYRYGHKRTPEGVEVRFEPV